MTKHEIILRIELLFICLQFDSQEEKLLTPGMRIVINQEIASLLYKSSFSNAEINKISDKVEERVTKIQNLIRQLDWLPLGDFPYDLNNEIQ